MHQSENNQGSALVLALIWTSLITLLVMSGLRLGSMTHTMVGAYKDYQQAMYLAETGVHQAILTLTITDQANPFISNSHTKVSLNKETWLDASDGKCYRVQAKTSYYLAQTTVVVDGCIDAHRVWQQRSWQELSS